MELLKDYDRAKAAGEDLTPYEDARRRVALIRAAGQVGRDSNIDFYQVYLKLMGEAEAFDAERRRRMDPVRRRMVLPVIANEKGFIDPRELGKVGEPERK